MNYEDFRREYLAGGLSRESLDPCPVRQFEKWLKQSVEAGLRDPTAMVLATIDGSGAPWQRIVLLKDVSTRGFVFYTNYGSAKARDIAGEPRVSLHFPWNELERQVIVGGSVEKMSVAEDINLLILSSLCSKASSVFIRSTVLPNRLATASRSALSSSRKGSLLNSCLSSR